MAEMLFAFEEVYRPASGQEEQTERLLRTHAQEMFGGFEYFDFRAPIKSPLGTRHADGALLSKHKSTWFVVEIERHEHSVRDHIEPQIEALAAGFYGEEARTYLARQGVAVDDFNADWSHPDFLLICDLATSEISNAATRNNFRVLEIQAFRAASNRFGIALSGFIPIGSSTTVVGGVDVYLEEESGIVLVKPFDYDVLPVPNSDLQIADRSVSVRMFGDRSAYALAMTLESAHQIVGTCDRYRLTNDFRLIPIDKTQ